MRSVINAREGLVATAAAAATAATTATATATATAVAAATTAATATTATAALFARPSFVDGQGAAVVLFAAKTSDGRFGLLVRAHLHERKTLAAAGVAVFDHLALRTVPNGANIASRSALLTE